MKSVNVAIPVDEWTAEALRQPGMRDAAGRFVSRFVERRHRRNVAHLFEVMDRFAAEARSNGLTDEILEAELEAYNAERRQPEGSPPTATPRG